MASSQSGTHPNNSEKQQASPKKKGGSIARMIIALILIFAVIGVCYAFSGELKVRYNSVWGNPIDIYIDGVRKGTYSSDVWVDFRTSPGTHTVEIRDISMGLGRLAIQTVSVGFFQSVNVDLHYGGIAL